MNHDDETALILGPPEQWEKELASGTSLKEAIENLRHEIQEHDRQWRNKLHQ